MNNENALIGFSGFVGTTLLKQENFSSCYRSTNIQEIKGKRFKMVVCAGAPAQKWIANREPETDRKQIDSLISNLETITCDQFVLISTVDVFKDPVGVDEDSRVEEDNLNPYGLHRRTLEKFVENNFPKHLIVRLPGLVGPGLRKNIIFDFLNSNNLRAIDSRGVFQFYPMVNLWYDIQTALAAGLSLVHLTAEPISVSDVSLKGFGRPFTQVISDTFPRYDLQSKYCKIFGSGDRYQYNSRESLQAIRAYAQSEPVTLNYGLS